jgi:hypothetical protein
MLQSAVRIVCVGEENGDTQGGKQRGDDPSVIVVELPGWPCQQRRFSKARRKSN